MREWSRLVSRTDLKERVRKRAFLLDGAMGTQLIARGIEVGVCNDCLNVESPDVVRDIHRAYFEAGSEAVLTNTFGANKYTLGRHGYGDRVSEINEAGARIAREAAGEDGYVLGDIGPSGDFLEPLGDELQEAFAEQAKALVGGGVDGFIIETVSALEEVEAAVEGVKSVCTELPVFASMAFESAGSDFRTMMGVDVESAVARIAALGVEAVGYNCGSASLEEYVELAGRFVSAAGGGVVILAEPNAGKPELVDGEAFYRVSPDEFATALRKIHSAGATILGGCCGTGPEHVAAVAGKLGR
jgi:methionine synthase I (cobalamin-dependent)